MGDFDPATGGGFSSGHPGGFHRNDGKRGYAKLSSGCRQRALNNCHFCHFDRREKSMSRMQWGILGFLVALAPRNDILQGSPALVPFRVCVRYETWTSPFYVIPAKAGIQEILNNTGYWSAPVWQRYWICRILQSSHEIFSGLWIQLRPVSYILRRLHRWKPINPAAPVTRYLAILQHTFLKDCECS